MMRFTNLIIILFLAHGRLSLCQDYYDDSSKNAGDEKKADNLYTNDIIIPANIEDIDEDEDAEVIMLGGGPEDEEKYKYTGKVHGRGIFNSVFTAFHKIYSYVKSKFSWVKRKSVEVMENRVKDTCYWIRHKGQSKWYKIKRDGSNAALNWHKDGDVKVLIHGFTPSLLLNNKQKIKKTKFFNMGDAYASLGKKHNVIIVDWTDLSTYPTLQYYNAKNYSAMVGPDIGEFLNKLKLRNLITDWSKVHMVGFGMGAHTAGIAGSWIKENGGGSIGRITGLDPTGFMYSENGELPEDKAEVLDPEDATFVDTIHCNMGKTILTTGAFEAGKMGTAAESGTVDFYPNGGKTQPNCSFESDLTKACSHFSCVQYFLESITKPMKSCPCESWADYVLGKCKCSGDTAVMMGENCSTSATGKVYLSTDDNDADMDDHGGNEVMNADRK